MFYLFSNGLKSENYSAQRALSKSNMRLETAYLKATEAFSNKALDISDRILATKYRIQAAPLAMLDKPVNACTSCITILKQLSDDPTINLKGRGGGGGGARGEGAELLTGLRGGANKFCICFWSQLLVYKIMQIAVYDEDCQFYRWPGVEYRVCARDVIKFSNPKLKSH